MSDRNTVTILLAPQKPVQIQHNDFRELQKNPMFLPVCWWWWGCGAIGRMSGDNRQIRRSKITYVDYNTITGITGYLAHSPTRGASKTWWYLDSRNLKLCPSCMSISFLFLSKYHYYSLSTSILILLHFTIASYDGRVYKHRQFGHYRARSALFFLPPRLTHGCVGSFFKSPIRLTVAYILSYERTPRYWAAGYCAFNDHDSRHLHYLIVRGYQRNIDLSRPYSSPPALLPHACFSCRGSLGSSEGQWGKGSQWLEQQVSYYPTCGIRGFGSQHLLWARSQKMWPGNFRLFCDKKFLYRIFCAFSGSSVHLQRICHIISKRFADGNTPQPSTLLSLPKVISSCRFGSCVDALPHIHDNTPWIDPPR